MEKIYTCECGRTFTKPNSFNAHKSHCKIHFESKGDLDTYYLRVDQTKSALQKGELIKGDIVKNKKKKLLDIWISEQHTCEKCGKVMTEKFGSGRFCSRSCANSRVHSETTKKKTSDSLHGRCVGGPKHLNTTVSSFIESYNNNPNLCIYCGAPLEYEKRHRKCCCQECANKVNSEKAIRRVDKIMHNNCYSGYYINVYFASSTELMYWIWCQDHSINIERNKQTYKYIDIDNKPRLYLPDFYLPQLDMLVEIKGKGFWYNKDNVDLKLESVKDKKIIIIYDNEFTIIENYFKITYGLKNRKQICEYFYNKG